MRRTISNKIITMKFPKRILFLNWVVLSFSILAEIPSPESKAICVSKNTGSWFSLKTLTSLQLTQDCKFEFHGPICESKGQLTSAFEEQGETIFKTAEIKDNSSCPFPGEKSCKYVLLSNEMLLDCGETGHESLIREKETINLGALEKNAAKGNKTAQKELASYYLQKNNFKKAKPILQKMAKAGDEEAISALGITHFYGSNGFKKNPYLSLKWNLIAIEKENAEAQYLVGQHYYKGLGVKKSYSEAREWFQKAATKNNVSAQRELARMWNKGIEGVVKKHDAKYWLGKAIEQGDSQAADMLVHLDDERIRELAEAKAEQAKEEQAKEEQAKAKQAEAKQAEAASLVKTEERKPTSAPSPTAFVTAGNLASNSKFSEGIFLVKPYFLLQERQGAVPSVALGITPGIQIDSLSIKLQASASLLNLGIGYTFPAFELGTVFGFKVEALFFEAGYGFEFWPQPSGSAQAVSVSVGKILSTEFLGVFPLKTISVGYAQTFFEDHTYKLFTAMTF